LNGIYQKYILFAELVKIEFHNANNSATTIAEHIAKI